MSPSDELIVPDHAPSYLAHRQTIGWLAISLPVILAAGNALIFGGNPILHSISRYYYTGMRDAFVGGLCAMAMFLIFYSGFDAWEDWTGNIAGVCALGVAFFPTTDGGPITVVGILHHVCAACLYLALSAYALLLFPRSLHIDSQATRNWDRAHRVCGLIMLCCVIAMALHNSIHWCDPSKCIFAFLVETIALEAFGISWLIEGRLLRSLA